MSNQPVIRAEQLGRDRSGRAVLADLSLQIHASEVVGLLGPNGAGKSTALRILAGESAPTRGTAVVAGAHVRTAPHQVRAQVGHAAEEPPTHGDHTPRSFARLAAALRDVPPERVESTLGDLDLIEVADVPLPALSRGTRRRVAIATALLHRPPVLLLDEPGAGLDPEQRDNLGALLHAAAEAGAAVLLSTHQLDVAAGFCDRVIVLREGSVVARGPAETPAGIAALYRSAR